MKGKLSKMWRSGISMLLVICMVVGMIPAVAFTARAEDNVPLKYVSLGDSMTNGYGLDGYDGNTGVEDYGDGSYANQFAEWLGADHHAQLAMSAMRAEDLHWLLEVDYDDPAVIEVINTLAGNHRYYRDNVEEFNALWYSVFTNGDYWTWRELLNDYRFDVAAYCIEGKDETDGGIFNEGSNEYPEGYKVAYDTYSDAEALKIVAKYYQESVANADIVSLGIGNGNFGVFMFGRITDAIGFGGSPEDTLVYDIENAIRECDPEMQAQIRTLMGEIETILAGKGIVANDGDDTTISTMEALYNVFMYTIVSYVLNYAGTVEAILQLNPDVELVQVALMNTMGGETIEGEITLTDLLNLIYVPLNAYLAALPTTMQATQNSVYADATFYWAEADFVECIVDTYVDGELNDTVRDRFYQSIVKDEDGDLGMVWGLLGNMVVPVTLTDIEAYEALDDAGKLAFAATDEDNADLAMSISMYLAFEKAIIAGKDTPVTVESVLGLSSLFEEGADPFGPIMTDFYAAAAVAGKAKLDTVATFVAQVAGMDAAAIKALLGDANAIKSVVWNYLYTERYYGNPFHGDIDAALECEDHNSSGLMYIDLCDEIKTHYAAMIADPVYGFVALNSNGLLTGAQVKTLYEAVFSDEAIYAVIAEKSGGMLDADKVATLAQVGVYAFAAGMIGGYTADEIRQAYENTGLSDEQRAMINGLRQLYNGIQTLKLEDTQNTINGGVAVANTAVTTVNRLCTLLVMPETLGTCVAESELSGLLALFARCVIGNGIGSHPSQAGHDALYEAVKSAYENEYTSADKTLDNALYIITTYYDEAYAYAYEYAKTEGYIDEAVAAIDGVIAELSAIEVPGTDAFKAEVAAEIEQIIETLEAAKALLTEADVLDQASLDALQALLNEAADAMVQLVDVLEQAGVDVNQVVIIPALKAAHAELVNEVIPAVIEALEEAVKAGTEYLIEKLGEAYDALVEATIKAVKKYAPEVADAVYDYLYNNPEEVINFFKTYGPTMVELMGEYGDEALMVVGYMLYTYGEDIAAYIVENHETILAAIVDWAEIHGENTIALIQVYAEALGLCDAVREQIAELEAELEKLETALNAKIDAIEKELEELNAQLETAVGEAKAEIEAKIAALEAELAALKAEVETKIAEVKAAIEELKAELEAAIESGLTKVENLKAALANLDEKVAELIEAAKNAALDQVNAAIKGMEDAMAQLDDTIHDLAGEVYEELKNLVGAAANELLNAVVEAVKKYAPELADEIYDYLYNNPEKVIAFFAEYGDEILALAEKYGDEVLMVVGYVLYTYGEDIAAYIIENHEQLLMFITEWISVHGENAAKLLQVYAETLGLCDLVRGEIAELEKALAELEAELEAQLNTLNNVLQAQLAALEAELARLKAELENAVEAQKPVIEAAIAEIEKQIEEIKAVIEEVKALIAEIEKQIKEIKALLPEMKEKLQDLVDSLFDLDAALQYLLEAGFDAAAPLVQKALNAVADAVEALVGVVSDAAAEELNKLIDEAKKALDEAYWDATHTDYTVDKDSYYVGLGDDLSAPESYVELLATELGIDFNNLAVNGLTMTDLLYILDEDFEADEYTLAKFELIYQQTGYTVEQMRAVYTSELAKADLVSVGVGSYGITDLIYAQAQGTLATILREQMGDYLNNPVIGGYIREILTGYGVNLEATTYTMDWYSYIGEDGVAELNEILANVRADLIEKDIPETYTYDFGVTVNEHIGLPLIQTGELEVTIPVADLITMMAETYMYAYVTHLYNAGEVFNSIHEITPEAELLVIGMFNPMDEVVLNFGDVSIALGDYYTYMVDVMNLRYLGYAFMVPKTTFVAIPDTVTTVEEYVMGYADLEQMLMALVLSNGTPAFETDVVPTVGGHEYIKEQILDALTITVVGLLGDADSNGVVNIRDAMLVAQYANNQISADALDLTVCDVDGNGVVNIRDAMLIAQYANMQISQFPIQ